MPDDKRSITATQRADISRKATQRAFMREMLMAAILARVWPAYRTPCDPRYKNDEYPELLCVNSPAGLLVWRVAEDEQSLFEHLEQRPYAGEKVIDRIPMLSLLASDGSYGRVE